MNTKQPILPPSDADTIVALRAQLSDAESRLDTAVGSLSTVARLLAESGHPEDRIRFALLHIDAYREGRARPDFSDPGFVALSAASRSTITSTVEGGSDDVLYNET